MSYCIFESRHSSLLRPYDEIFDMISNDPNGFNMRLYITTLYYEVCGCYQGDVNHSLANAWRFVTYLMDKNLHNTFIEIDSRYVFIYVELCHYMCNHL